MHSLTCGRKRRSERYYYEWEARQILLDSPSVVLRETNSLDEILTHLNRYPVGSRIPLGVLEARDRKYCICRLEHSEQWDEVVEKLRKRMDGSEWIEIKL